VMIIPANTIYSSKTAPRLSLANLANNFLIFYLPLEDFYQPQSPHKHCKTFVTAPSAIHNQKPISLVYVAKPIMCMRPLSSSRTDSTHLGG
jgi:hypothetical protein